MELWKIFSSSQYRKIFEGLSHVYSKKKKILLYMRQKNFKIGVLKLPQVVREGVPERAR